MKRLASVALLLLLGVATTACPRRGSGRGHQPPPPPPPCHVDGVFQLMAQRTGSTGSVCNLNDLRQLSEQITIGRTGPQSAQVHQKGNYAHDAHVDAYACAVWTDRTPTYSRNVLGSKVSGHAAYRVQVRPDGTLAGTLQLYVQSNNLLVPGCSASFNLSGRRAM
ncbi:MAG: hypothetical protein JRI23_18085 [Deltaproteobacteria bacterium]|nr:hypothetical protein [Deltaproteobacteria bacterium]MBW2533756.1 hypothetical protein [Deltaproteobacteria bacterium]